MERETARQEIRSRWKELYPRDKAGKGIICPLCGSGQGKHGTGITENPRKHGSLKCWACDFSGDAIDLLQQERGLDYNGALEAAADSLGITIDPYRPQDTPQRHAERAQDGKNDSGHIKAHETKASPAEGKLDGTEGQEKNFTEYYKECRARLNNPAAISYLQARGISTDTAAAYWIGYAPEWQSPTALERGKNPPKSPRLIIPTSSGHYIARDVRHDLTDAEKQFAKMNEGKPHIFNEKALYNDTAAVFITEGIFDALSIIECGAAAIALNSTSNADALIKLLEEKRTGATLILALDNDSAGQRAAQTIKEGLQRLNISYVATADICGGRKDPNEALTADKGAFAAAVQKAQAQTAAKPDNVTAYIDLLMSGEIEKFRQAKDRKTGYSNLDAQAGGLYGGLYCIAATSSLGKTTFSHQMADQLAAAGHDVLFFSMEQSRLELVSKSLARITAQKDAKTAVTSLSIRKGYLPENVLNAADEYKAAIADRLSIIEGNFNCNISFIGEYVRGYIKRTGCKPVIFIDYLQILQPAEDAGKRQTTKEMVDSTITELKRISREHDITVFIISSVNRANYLTPIDFESLKESGGIEYTCDVIWGLQLQCLNEPLFDDQKKLKEKRERVKQEKRAEPRKIELVCLKNRYGIANFSVYFDYYPKNDLFTPGDGGEFETAHNTPFAAVKI